MASTCEGCGTPIHPDTAKWNAGLCMACAKRRPPGADERRNASAAKRLAAHVTNSAEAAVQARRRSFEESLRARVHGPGGSIDLLSQDEQRYFLLQDLLFQLEEGGVFCFFVNSAGNHYSEVLTVLRELGLTRMAEGLAEAKAALFGENAVPGDVDGRRRFMPVNRQGEPKLQARKTLAAIDERTKNAEAAIEAAMEKIARANSFY